MSTRCSLIFFSSSFDFGWFLFSMKISTHKYFEEWKSSEQCSNCLKLDIFRFPHSFTIKSPINVWSMHWHRLWFYQHILFALCYRSVIHFQLSTLLVNCLARMSEFGLNKLKTFEGYPNLYSLCLRLNIWIRSYVDFKSIIPSPHRKRELQFSPYRNWNKNRIRKTNKQVEDGCVVYQCIGFGQFSPWFSAVFFCVSVECHIFLMIKVLNSFFSRCHECMSVTLSRMVQFFFLFCVRTILFLVFFILCAFFHCNLLIEAELCSVNWTEEKKKKKRIDTQKMKATANQAHT